MFGIVKEISPTQPTTGQDPETKYKKSSLENEQLIAIFGKVKQVLQNKLTEGRRFVVTQFAGIAHVTPDFPRVLELGRDIGCTVVDVTPAPSVLDRFKEAA